MNLIKNFKYRAEIDGLRAIAVMAVVLYHAGFGCPGGYVGVDVFFVISGFLITSLIWKDLESGKFSFANFWERRARRIVPALVVVTLVTLIAGWFLLLPSDYANLGKASASQALFAANFHYWLDSGYFTGAAEEKPLLHTWSLAVEEQFYLMVPFLLWAGFHFRGWLRSRKAILTLLIVGCVLSLAISVYGVIHYPSAAFYLLPTRAWELLFGSIVAFLPYSIAIHRRKSICETVSLLGMALILGPVFFYTSETPFPGLAAMPPVLGTCLLIWGNTRQEGVVETVIGKAISIRPVVFIGLISYSLYLWHWPLLAFSNYWALEPLALGYRLGMVMLGLILAYASWKFVETPFRTRRFGVSRKTMFTYSGLALVGIFFIGVYCSQKDGIEYRWSPEIVRYDSTVRIDDDYIGNKYSWSKISNEVTEDFKFVNATDLGVVTKNQPATVVLWGDSHASCFKPALDLLLRERGVKGVSYTSSATAPTLAWYNAKSRVHDVAIQLNDSIFNYILKNNIKDVVFVARWSIYVNQLKKMKHL